jgi:hypothetical protein
MAVEGRDQGYRAFEQIVQRKRRPTSKVDPMMVLRARRGGTGS